MQCETVLPGTECTFWKKSGCSAEGGSCQVVVEQCQGCERIVKGSIGEVCTSYPQPSTKWATGLCNFATHKKVDLKSNDVRVNPLKAAKRAAAGKKKK
ncbi:PxxKW family cysteine-rich protein [Pelobacter seleniigenes]|uniref:PxxKW family cysteine-rich protein n=1 Tax=Pelobacter seleniigenes TaxID=407188 RepID=UPI0004A774E4|nr:PxxKW family cysteine-rich protein [Pelobacter seleniigenes]